MSLEQEPTGDLTLFKRTFDGTENFTVGTLVTFAADQLRNKFGVEDLTTIEFLRLRLYVRAAIDLWTRYEHQISAKEISRAYQISIEQEAAYTWLQETYGVDWPTMADEMANEESTASQEFKEWLAITRARSHLL